MNMIAELATIMALIGCAYFLSCIFDSLGQLFDYWQYRRARKRFAVEVKAGRTPNWVPIFIDKYGVLSIEPEDLFQTRQFKTQLAAVGRLSKRPKG